MITELFRLKPMRNDPRFEGFWYAKEEKSLLGRADLRDDLSPFVNAINKKIPSLAELWKPIPVVGDIADFNDYPPFDKAPVFSKRAVDALSELLNSGELLPLDAESGEYFLYHITHFVELLDLDKAKIVFNIDHPGLALAVERFELVGTENVQFSIFRIPQLPYDVFVDQRFVERVNECKLGGFKFEKVWPHSVTDVQGESISKGIKAEAVVGCFDLACQKPSPAEEKRFEKVKSEINELLKVRRTGEPYFGALEIIELFSGRFRIVLSCPDGIALVNQLQNWASTQKWWKGKITFSHVEKPFYDIGENLPSLLSVERLDSELMSQVEESTQEGMDRLELDAATAPDSVVKQIDDLIAGLNQQKIEVDDDVPIMLGTTLGHQLVRTLDWNWHLVQRDDMESATLAVMPEDQSLAIYPIVAVAECIERASSPHFGLLLDMLVSKQIASAPFTHTDAMRNLSTIVPD